MNRGKETLTASENVRVPLTRGNALLVQLTGTGFTGTVDFKSTVDSGVSYANHPYTPQHNILPTRSVAQISAVTSAVTYLLTAPLIDARIDVVVSAGSILVVYREVEIEN